MSFAANTLIVSSSEKSRNTLSGFFCSDDFLAVAAVSCGGDARRLLVNCEFDLIIINTPLRDEFGDELAVQCTERNMGALLLVPAEFADILNNKVEDYGVFVLEKPLDRLMFDQAVRLVLTARKRAIKASPAGGNMKEKMDEIRLIERAKRVLIKVLGMSEPQAHRYIERQAMDLRVKRSEIAKNVLRTYEN